MTFEEVRKDYLEIIEAHGMPEDMTGGFVDAQHMEIVIRNPTKANAKNYMISVIYYGFQLGEFWNAEGGETSIYDSNIADRIYRKYITFE